VIGYYRGWMFYSEENIVKQQQNVSEHGMFEGPFPKGMRGTRFGKCCSKEAAVNKLLLLKNKGR